MVLQNPKTSKVGCVVTTNDDDDDNDSSTCAQLRRKRQRTEMASKDGNGNAINDKTVTTTTTESLGSSNLNQYQGWTVPESNYQLPILSFDDNENGKDDELTPERFYEHYVRRRRPVVMRGTSLSSAVLGLETTQPTRIGTPPPHLLVQWMSSNHDLLKRAGDAIVTVEKRLHHGDSFGKGHKEVSMSFREFMKLIDNGDSLHYLTTQDVEADRDTGRPELMSPFMEQLRGGGSLLGWRRNDSDSNDKDNVDINTDTDTSPIAFPLRPKLVGNLVPQNINVWIGNSPLSSSSSSGLHHDYHDNLYLVLRGTKRFRLFSPADAANMYTRGTLSKVHTNGRINYVGERTTAYGADPDSDAAARAARLKDEAAQRLAAAERAVEEGQPGAADALETAEAMLDEAMEAILDAETGHPSDSDSDSDSDNDNDDEEEDEQEEEFCFESAREEDVKAIMDKVDHPLSSSSEEDGDVDIDVDEADLGRRIVDKTAKNPNNFSRIDPSILDDPEQLQKEFPKMLDAKAAFCECSAGDILYLPASWFHEVRSSSNGNDNNNGNNGTSTTLPKGHMALNYWFHPPDALDDFENPYTTDFWPNDFKDRFK